MLINSVGNNSSGINQTGTECFDKIKLVSLKGLGWIVDLGESGIS
jgi:hypothetical protein